MPAAKVHIMPEDYVASAAETGSKICGEEASASNKVVKQTPYQRLVWGLHHDEKWLREVNLGKRVGLYRFRGDLGTGNFSQVKLAVHQLTRERVAIKILDKSKLDQKTQKMLSREISTMEAIHHPNIIRLYEVVETLSKIHLVMEYASGGELFNRITRLGRLDELEAKPLFAQVIAAIQHMHDSNFIHRDIKAENVFYAGSGLVKVGDFGFSTRVSSPGQHLNTFCGSPPYAAPELFRDESYVGAPVDIWALGVLLYFMVTGAMPFKAQTVASLKRHILDGAFVIPDKISGNCAKLIRNILQQKSEDRYTLSEIKASEWMLGTTFPSSGGLKKFTIVPSVGLDASEIEEVELEARRKLKDLGITEAMLRDNADRGAKSSVIGAYRIIVHRCQKKGNHESDVDEFHEEVNASPTFSAPKKSSKNRPSAGKGVKSKTCTIL